jgi:hypothetical protein
MGLAKSVASEQWAVQSDFETVLRTLQRTADRQKMLAAHGALLSDPRLPFEITSRLLVANLNDLTWTDLL